MQRGQISYSVLTIQFKNFELAFLEQQFKYTDKQFLDFKKRVIADFS